MNAPGRIFACVMAGGSGERFWPMSRKAMPKHLLRLVGEQPMLAETVARLEGAVDPEGVFVLTNAAQAGATRAALPGLPGDHVIAEPAKRDTAPACALATAIAASHGGDPVCAVLPADAMIHDAATFRRQFLDAAAVAGSSDSIVTLGIPPTHPATGFGYLERGAARAGAPGGSAVHDLVRFVEKPDLQTATTYLAGGQFLWNAGIFFWKVSTFVAEARRQCPELADFIEGFPGLDGAQAYLEKTFPNLPKISVDYAIMEHARSLATLPAEFDWDDVGAWTALPKHLGADAAGNTTRGPVAVHDASRNIAISNGRTIALCGVNDLVVVETPDAILVCHRDAVQEVKTLQPDLPDAVR